MSANSSRVCNQMATKPSQHFGTSTVECPRKGDMRKYASVKERAAKNQKTAVCHFGFTEKVYRLLCTAYIGNAEVVDSVIAYDQGCKTQESLWCKVIVWDDATMSNKLALEAVEDTFQDMRGRDLCTFGGSAMVFSGDLHYVQMRLMLASRFPSYGSMIKLCTYSLTCGVHLRAGTLAGKSDDILLKKWIGEHPHSFGSGLQFESHWKVAMS